MEYSKLSKELTSKLSKNVKKNNGIYFTPPSCVDTNIKLLTPYLENIINVIEPSCGSCEYITALHKSYPHLNITGIELNETIYRDILYINNGKINIINIDYLKYESAIKYDLIIGNPPYFVMKKDDVDKSYHTYFEGRPNIFILFIIKSLHSLKPDGILSFILPKNFLNCLYYDKTRKYINDNFQILHIVDCNDDYIETQQETIIIIIKNTNTQKHQNNEYCLIIENYTIFGISENIIKLKSLYINHSTLKELGFIVTVGNIVWNQCKNELTDDKTKTLLIYSSYIKNKLLKIQNYSNEEKKNYINKPGERGPLLVINRGYGVGKYSFEYCLINNDFDYLIENHLICIRYTKPISNEELIILYKKIIISFDSKKTKEFIKLYFGNNAMNTTELCEILPIYDI